MPWCNPPDAIPRIPSETMRIAMKNIVAALGMGLLLAASLADAATCRAELKVSTPSERFGASGETVADTKTTLIWMRCAIGQQWTGSACAGEPQAMDWNEEATLVERRNREGYAGRND